MCYVCVLIWVSIKIISSICVSATAWVPVLYSKVTWICAWPQWNPHMFIKQIFFEHLLCAKCWGYGDKYDGFWLCLQGTSCSWRKESHVIHSKWWFSVILCTTYVYRIEQKRTASTFKKKVTNILVTMDPVVLARPRTWEPQIFLCLLFLSISI